MEIDVPPAPRAESPVPCSPRTGGRAADCIEARSSPKAGNGVAPEERADAAVVDAEPEHSPEACLLITAHRAHRLPALAAALEVPEPIVGRLCSGASPLAQLPFCEAVVAAVDPEIGGLRRHLPLDTEAVRGMLPLFDRAMQHDMAEGTRRCYTLACAVDVAEVVFGFARHHDVRRLGELRPEAAGTAFALLDYMAAGEALDPRWAPLTAHLEGRLAQGDPCDCVNALHACGRTAGAYRRQVDAWVAEPLSLCVALPRLSAPAAHAVLSRDDLPLYEADIEALAAQYHREHSLSPSDGDGDGDVRPAQAVRWNAFCLRHLIAGREPATLLTASRRLQLIEAATRAPNADLDRRCWQSTPRPRPVGKDRYWGEGQVIHMERDLRDGAGQQWSWRCMDVRRGEDFLLPMRLDAKDSCIAAITGSNSAFCLQLHGANGEPVRLGEAIERAGRGEAVFGRVSRDR